MVFRPSFHGSWFASEGADINSFGGANFDEMAEGYGAVARAARMNAEAFMTCHDEIKYAFEADVPYRCGIFLGGPLHDAADEIEGNDTHPEGFVSHFRAFDFESFHAKRGFQIAELQFDVPTPGVEFREFDAAVFDRINESRDDDQFAFFSNAVFVAEFDESDLQLVGQRAPSFTTELAAGGLLRASPGDDPFIAGYAFPLFPV